jgi:glycosyltransferase involved in cell wall biosynthesis
MVVNSDWFFLSHRLPIALAALEAGMRVTIVAPDTGRGADIRAHGLGFEPLALARAGRNPVRELAVARALRRIYRRIQPDVLHHVTPKPLLWGTLAARSLGIRAVANAVTGLGFVFAQGTRPLRVVATELYRGALRTPGSLTIFQNPDDMDLFVHLGLVRRESSVLIRGSGVDVDRFLPPDTDPDPPVAMFASRLLRDKGVERFVAAARAVRARGVPARWVLVGSPDPENPGSVDEATVRSWVAEGVVEWWGHRTDMPRALAEASVVVLPTEYREGLPKVLAEAASCSRPIVTTATPGCREVVLHERTGLLVRPGDAAGLATACATLLADPQLRRQYGAAGREWATRCLSLAQVVAEHLEVYAALCRA